MLPFLLLNVVVSAAVILAILWWWDGRSDNGSLVLEPPPGTLEAETPLLVAASPTPQPPAQDEDSQAEESGGESTTHIVRAGDTLGVISVEYDVSVDAIMEANGLDNPNLISIGQELVIPGEGFEAQPLPEVEVEESQEASGELTPLPPEPAGEGEASIAIAGVEGVGLIEGEAVQIVNDGTSEASLSGWKLADEGGNVYTFGQITLFGEGAGIKIHSASGDDRPTDIYWGQTDALWQSGDLVRLFDAQGTVRSEFIIP